MTGRLLGITISTTTTETLLKHKDLVLDGTRHRQGRDRPGAPSDMGVDKGLWSPYNLVPGWGRLWLEGISRGAEGGHDPLGGPGGGCPELILGRRNCGF